MEGPLKVLPPNSQAMDPLDDCLETYNVSGKGLRKLDRCSNGTFQCLILDRNELTRLENAETYGDQLVKLSVSENKLVRMYGICRLLNLQVVDLSKNSIVSIEGLRELVHLQYLNLSGNKIKAVEHLSTNVALEHLDLSHNCVCTITDINKLKSLKNLQLDFNNIKTLGNVQSYFPAFLEVLSLANNSIADLNQMLYLNELVKLNTLTISGNTCINMTGNVAGFDYRPFVLNWCQNVKNLDGYVVGSKESLKAEWLYSMGKGRHFQPGEHAELVDYLSTICPLTTADNVMSAEDAKLSRILSKRREHQQQLLDELSTIMTTTNHDSSIQEQLNDTTLTSDNNSHSSLRRLSWTYDDISHQESTSVVTNTGDDSDVEVGAVGNETSLMSESLYVPVPETMLSPDFRPVHISPQCSLFNLDNDSVMTRSWDCNSTNVMAKSWDGGSTMTKSWDANATPNWLQRSSIPRKVASSCSNRSRPNRTSLTDSPILRRPTQVQRLQRSVRPLSLSPSYGRRPPSSSPKKVPVKTSRSSSEDDSTDSDVSVSKLTLVKKAAELRMATKANKQKPSAKKESVVVTTAKTANARDKAAVVIQAAWRGHATRKSTFVRDEIRVRKTEDHIRNLQEKLAETQRELELEKRLRALQMEAIRSLWKEVQQMQTATVEARATPSDSGVDSIATSEVRTSTPKITTTKDDTAEMMSHLVTTCNSLQQQVQQLQESLHLVSSYVIKTGTIDNVDQFFRPKCPPVTTTDVIIPQRRELTESDCDNNSSTMNGANDLCVPSTETKEPVTNENGTY